MTAHVPRDPRAYDIARRHDEIRANPDLRAQLDRLRRGRTDRVPVAVKLARLAMEREEEK